MGAPETTSVDQTAAGTWTTLGHGACCPARFLFSEHRSYSDLTQNLHRVIMPPSPIKQYEPHYSPSPSTLSCLAVKKCMYFIPFASLSPTDTPLSSSPGVFIPLSCIPFAVAIYIRSFPPFLSLPPPLSSKLYQLSP